LIVRKKYDEIKNLLASFPAVALLGSRQVGKTTLAFELAKGKESVYLDLENEQDRAKISNPTEYLSRHQEKLVILDEVQRIPELFQELRGIIDENRRQGRKVGQFLLLGSASMELMRQSESLAGRIAYSELSPVLVSEYGNKIEKLWLRGGFPNSLLATDLNQSMVWRKNFIRTYLERDIPQLGPKIPAETLSRFWTMLAHLQGSILNASTIASSLGIDGKTAMRYLDLMVDLLLVRRLAPYHANLGKRLIKSPKIYIRDSGILHALLSINDHEMLLGHPIIGMSWEGFVIENILSTIESSAYNCYYYRTSSGSEIDLVIERSSLEIWTVEVKRTMAPKFSKGHRIACEAIGATKNFIIYPGTDRFPLEKNMEVIGLTDFIKNILP